METNIKILGWLHIVLHGITLLVGLFVLLLTVMIGHAFQVPFLGGIGLIFFLFFAALSIPGVIVGWGLLNYAPWARVLGIIIAILELFHFPFGTALGVYGLVVLFDPQTVALFEGSGRMTY